MSDICSMRLVVVGSISFGLLLLCHHLLGSLTADKNSNFNQIDPILQSALSRAPPQCTQRIKDYYTRQMNGDLKLEYSPDPEAAEICSPTSLAVPMSGPDLGKILKYPKPLRTLLPPHFEESRQSNNASEYTSPYSLAFIILLHGEQTPLAIDRLVSSLHRPHHRLLVHVDSKAPSTLHSHVAEIARRSSGSIAVLQPSRTVNWGGPSMLQVPTPSLSPLCQSRMSAHHAPAFSFSGQR